MQEKTDNSQPMGIFQRLINFVITSIFGQRINNTIPRVEVPIEGPSTKVKSPIRPSNKLNGVSDSEILVDFRHTDGLESWTAVDEYGSSVHAPGHDGLHTGILHKDIERKGKGHNRYSAPNIDPLPHRRKISIMNGNDGAHNGKGLKEFEAFYSKGTRRKGPNKDTSPKGKTREKETEQTVLEDHDEEIKPKPAKRIGPLLTVASNINEKSDAFIRSRREAMRRNYSLEQKRS